MEVLSLDPCFMLDFKAVVLPVELSLSLPVGVALTVPGGAFFRLPVVFLSGLGVLSASVELISLDSEMSLLEWGWALGLGFSVA